MTDSKGEDAGQQNEDNQNDEHVELEEIRDTWNERERDSGWTYILKRWILACVQLNGEGDETQNGQ